MKNVVASYVLSNTASINLYEIDYVEDQILAGINDQEPEWCPIDYAEDTFKFREMNIPLSECMRM